MISNNNDSSNSNSAMAVSLTGATTTDATKMVFSIQPAAAAVSGTPTASCSHNHNHSHGHSHGHSHHNKSPSLSSSPRPIVSLNVPMSELVTQYADEPQQLFNILLYMVKMAHFALFQELVEQLPVGSNKTNNILQSRDAQGHSLLHWAAKRSDDVQFVEYLLKAYSSSSATTITTKMSTLVDEETGMTPLHWACTESNNLVVLDHLLQHEPSAIDIKDKTGCTPLLIAAQHGQVETCAFLLQRGAHRQAQDSSRDTAMHWAAYKGSLMVLGLLSFHDDSSNSSASGLCLPDMYGQTPLHLAALRGHSSVCRYIINQVLTHKPTPATKRQVKELLFLQDKNGRTAHALAVHKQKMSVAVLLKERMDWLTLTPKQQVQTSIQRNLRQLCSKQAWATWMGYSNGEGGDLVDEESPLFPFYYVQSHMVANPIFYYMVLCPLWNPGAGVMWDKMGLHIFMFLLFIATCHVFYKTYHINPGHLKDHPDMLAYWRRQYEQTLESLAKTTDTSQHKSLCHTCHIVRPPRSKHDRYTHGCVLLFDHHCPFVGATVGLYNYKYFFLFLCGMTLYLFLLMVELIMYYRRSTHMSMTTLVIGIFLGAHGLASGAMLVYHTQLTFMNLTTNEHLNLQRYEYFWEYRQDGSRRFHNPWNKGWLLNYLDRWEPSESSYMLQPIQPPRHIMSNLEMSNLLDHVDSPERSIRPSFDNDHHVV